MKPYTVRRLISWRSGVAAGMNVIMKILSFVLFAGIFVGCNTAVTPVASPSQQSAYPVPRVTCVPLRDAKFIVDETICVEGTVKTAHNESNDFIMDFQERDSDFVAIGRNYFLLNIEGHCLRVQGSVTMRDRKYAIIGSSPSSFSTCS